MIIEARMPGVVMTLKLVSGEEIVGSFVKEDDKKITLRKPLMAALTQQGPTLTPFIFTVDVMGDTPELSFDKTHVLVATTTFKPFADAYRQATSGIASPNSMPGLV